MTTSVCRFAICAALLCVLVTAQETPPHLNGSSAGKSSPTKDTAVRENAFSLTLPGRWSTDASDDPARRSYHASNGREFLTVSLLVFAHRLSTQEQHQTIKKMAEIRRGVETKVPGVTALTMTETTFGEADGILAARYGGVEPATGRRFHALLLCSPLAVTVYYYEARGLSEVEAASRARAIMNSIAVPK